MSDQNYEKQVVALLQNDELGVSRWASKLDPMLMEKWALRCDMSAIPAKRDDLLELVRRVNTMGFIPLRPIWESHFTEEVGLPPIDWLVGTANGVRFIEFHVRTAYLKDGVDEAAVEAITQPLVAPLIPSAIQITMGEEIKVRLAWVDGQPQDEEE